MKTAFFIAKRYLLSKKSHNAINIVSGISAAGVCVATAALICVLSVLNGFNGLIESMFSAFDPDLRITAIEGKSLHTDSVSVIKKLPEIALFAETIEENALVHFANKQQPAKIKGVDTCFAALTSIDSIMFDGEYMVYDGAFERCVAGVGLANKMGFNAHFIDPVRIYAPQRNKRINLLRPDRNFNEAAVFISGIFSVQQSEYDDNYLLVSLSLARELFDYAPQQATAIELKLAPGANTKETKRKIQELIGEKYSIKDRYEQQADFFRIVSIEKWMTFFILSFILLIATFNIIGSLSMLIIEKKEDIEILRAMGATEKLVRRIFLLEGWLISTLGALIGLIIGLALCLTQEHFGWLSMGSGYVIEAYPVAVRVMDIIIILFTVLLLGFVAAWYPSRKIKLT